MDRRTRHLRRNRTRRAVLGFQSLEDRRLLTVSGEITTDTTWSSDTVISGDLTIRPSITLTVASGVRVTIEEGADLFVEGTFDVGTNASVRMDDGNSFVLGSDNRIEVRTGGALFATDSLFDRNGTGTDLTQLIIQSGAEFSFTDSNFDLDRLVLQDGSVIVGSGVTGNGFDTPLSHLFPGNPNLLDNERFLDVEILAGQTINNGESLTLLPMGTVTTTNMNYRINSLTISPGGSLALGPGSRTFAEEAVQLSIAGSMHVNNAGFFNMIDGDDNVAGFDNLIEVLDGGSLRLTDTILDRTVSGDQRDLTRLIVRTGGQFEASDTTFDLDRIVLEDASAIGPNGVSGNRFDVPIFTPLAHLFPSNPNLLNNERFFDVEILAGQTINNGESLTLLPMGTVTTTNMNYRLNELTVAAGGTFILGPDSRTFAEEAVQLSIAGLMHVDNADFFNMIDGDDNVAGFNNLIEVVDGGNLRFTNTSFVRTASGDQRDLTRLIVRSGGQLEASDTTFDVDQIIFEDASVIGAGGVVGNRFDVPIFTPLAHLFPGNPNLLNNERFFDVEILTGQTINNGESLTLLPLGTAVTTNMNYRINDLTVAAGGSLTFGPGTRTIGEESLLLSIGGTVHVNRAEFFNVIDGDDNVSGTQNLIEVIEGGNLRLTNTRIDRIPSGDERDLTQLTIFDGGRITMTDSFFGLERLRLLGDQTTILRNDINSQVTVHGGTLLDFELNDLSDLASTTTDSSPSMIPALSWTFAAITGAPRSARKSKRRSCTRLMTRLVR
ncbi:MAG: hypothetical protein AAFX06_02830 [Planctomycetota bacterium]